MNLFARVLLFLLVVTSWVSVHAYADVAQGLSWLAKQQQITGDSALTFTPLIVFGVLLAAFLAIELYLDFLAINGRCDAFGSLIAGAIVATVVGAFVVPLIAIVLAYTALLAGNGAIVAASSSICRR